MTNKEWWRRQQTKPLEQILAERQEMNQNETSEILSTGEFHKSVLIGALIYLIIDSQDPDYEIYLWTLSTASKALEISMAEVEVDLVRRQKEYKELVAETKYANLTEKNEEDVEENEGEGI